MSGTADPKAHDDRKKKKERKKPAEESNVPVRQPVCAGGWTVRVCVCVCV